MDVVEQVLTLLRQKLPELMQSGEGCQVELHVKTDTIQVHIRTNEGYRFSGKLQPLIERRR